MRKTTFNVTLDEQRILMDLSNGVTVRIFEGNNPRFKCEENEIFLLAKKNQIVLIGHDKKLIDKLEFDHVIVLNVAALDLEVKYLTAYLVQFAVEAGLKLAVEPEHIKIPENIFKSCARELDDALKALNAFGYKLEKKKFVSPKAQHRWKKAISGIVFHVDYKGASADIIWEKSTEMRIKKGAKMLPDSECPRRADGSLGLPWTFTKALRDDHKAQFDEKTWVTLEDVVLRSVNEVSYFLYFAGTNSWLLFLDDAGRSIHELTVVK